MRVVYTGTPFGLPMFALAIEELFCYHGVN
jgi:hypothetical protein